MKKQKLAIVLACGLMLAACGKKEAEAPVSAAPTPAATTTAPAPAAAPVASTVAVASEAAAPAADNSAGKSVFGKTCSLCHAAGVAGAPKPGDKGDWGPRIAQGNDTLYKHALEGFTGQKGMMPARGGNASLSDADVKAAVDYMVGQSR